MKAKKKFARNMTDEEAFDAMIRGTISKEQFEARNIRVGTRVETLVPFANSSPIPKGEKGTVRSALRNEIGIEFDNAFPGLHSMSGQCKNHHGWYMHLSHFTNQAELAVIDE